MADYTAGMAWERGTQDLLNGCYSRRHLMRFDGAEAPGSSSAPNPVRTGIRCEPVPGNA